VQLADEAAQVLRHLYFRLQATVPGDKLARYRFCYSAVRSLMPVDTFYFGWYRSGHRLSLPFRVVNSEFAGPDVQIYGPHGMSAWLAVSRRTYRWAHDNGRMVRGSYPADADDTRDAMITPLLAQKSGEVVGMMGIVSSQQGAYDEECVALAEWIAKALMVVLEAHEETAQLLDLRTLFPGSATQSPRDAAAVLDTVQVQLVAARALVDGLRVLPNLPQEATSMAEEAVAVLAGAQDFIVRSTEHPDADGRDELALLSEREREVALLIACDKLSNAQLAARLGISENTVKKHVSNVLRKLGVRQRGDIPQREG